MNNYIVLVVSSGYHAEDKFIEFINTGKKNDVVDKSSWDYVVTNGQFYLKDSFNKEDFNFVLINQCSFNKSSLDELIKEIKVKHNKNIIVWSHRTPVGTCASITKKMMVDKGIDPYIFIPFSHGENSGAEWFLQLLRNNVSVEVYNTAFNLLIQKSLSSPTHLIALSILCQGYLAAHGEINLPEGISIIDTNKTLTDKQNWWEPVFNEDKKEDKKFENTKVYEELKAKGKDYSTNSPIARLFVAIAKPDANRIELVKNANVAVIEAIMSK